jgi:predicted lipoprotein with Yx(FWY)xxD motif
MEGPVARPHIMRAFIVVTCAVLVLVLVSGTSAGTATGKAKVAVGSSSYGHVLFDGRGFVLYAFTHDRPGRSTCKGDCAKAWPPFLVARKPRAGTGAKASLLGVVRRANGKLQATYAGRPLYYYVGDTKPGQILCQNVLEFGGYWRVVRPSGKPVR